MHFCLRESGSPIITDLWLPRGRGREWYRLRVWVSGGKLLHVEWISNVILLLSTGNSM